MKVNYRLNKIAQMKRREKTGKKPITILLEKPEMINFIYEYRMLI